MGFVKNHVRIDSSTLGILRIVLPLVLSALSENLMFLIDRMVLAYYSVDSMDAALLGGYLPCILTLVLMSIAGMTEVFIGQYNGAAMDDKVASPVWQMIYFALFAALFAIPIGYFSHHLHIFPPCYAAESYTYQRILIYFCWLPALTAAFTGFFVGQGKTKIIIAIVFLGTVVNTALDVLLIFGCGKLIPPMGCAGAAIGTIVAEAVQVIVLAIGFWSAKNRKIYHTAKNYRFDWALLRRCFSLGFPLSIGRCMEMVAWQVVCVVLGFASKDLMTVHGFAVTIYVFFTFISDGIVKGTAAITANFIGQRNLMDAKRALVKIVFLTLLLCSMVVLPMLLHPNFVFGLLNKLHGDLAPLHPAIVATMRVMFLNVMLEELWCILWGVLIGGGDTRYPVIVTTCSVWIVVVIPVLVLFYCGKLQSAVIVQYLSIIGNAACVVFLYLLYRSLKWYKSVADGVTL
jgi:MATE family multidrug resistance protein